MKNTCGWIFVFGFLLAQSFSQISVFSRIFQYHLSLCSRFKTAACFSNLGEMSDMNCFSMVFSHGLTFDSFTSYTHVRSVCPFSMPCLSLIFTTVRWLCSVVTSRHSKTNVLTNFLGSYIIYNIFMFIYT